ncbi:MAG: sulfatase [Fuerstiella sp.]|nr:sulfatase [Fuerstiella sp.]MCP4856825.1 sulfatase [Fuerstiella sp.]
MTPRIRRVFHRAALVAVAALIARGGVVTAGDSGDRRPMNVLFLAVDDLRPQLGCYGQTQMITPNIDALAAQGMLFHRAYCQSAICGPSRASLLTGLRPDTSGIIRNRPSVSQAVPDILTLPRQFKSHGYHTVSIGKIYHGPGDDKGGWSERPVRPRGGYNLPANQAIMVAYARGLAEGKDPPRGPVVEAADVPDEGYSDGVVANLAIEALRKIKDKPFFLATGFSKPHMPFACPRKYWDMYPEESIRLADNPLLPDGAPEIAPYNWDEMRAYNDIDDDGSLTDEKRRQLIRGYCACVSYADAQVGKVVAELDRLDLRENTIVILWGDHGWHLGENGQWGKHTNYEQATRAPLILSVPGMKNVGQSTDALVEFVDIYPTLSELCNQPLPDHLEGRSFSALLEDPNLAWKTAAFSQVLRWDRGMGYTMRTEKYRYARWQDPRGNIVGHEIYDHVDDPQENTNLANRPESAQLLQQLDQQLNAGWREALP